MNQWRNHENCHVITKTVTKTITKTIRIIVKTTKTSIGRKEIIILLNFIKLNAGFHGFPDDLYSFHDGFRAGFRDFVTVFVITSQIHMVYVIALVITSLISMGGRFLTQPYFFYFYQCAMIEVIKYGWKRICSSVWYVFARQTVCTQPFRIEWKVYVRSWAPKRTPPSKKKYWVCMRKRLSISMLTPAPRSPRPNVEM